MISNLYNLLISFANFLIKNFVEKMIFLKFLVLENFLIFEFFFISIVAVGKHVLIAQQRAILVVF